MAYILDRPQINGATEKEQLAQIRNYLFKQVEQLQFALNDIEVGGSASYKAQQIPQSASAIFGSIKGLIKGSEDIINEYYAKIEPLIVELIQSGGSSGGGVDADRINAIIEEALQNAKDSGAFKGEKGDPGTSVTITNISESTLDGGVNTVTFSDGKKLNIKNGSAGSSGGFGGMTDADKNEMVNMVLASLPTWNGGSY